MTYAVRLMLGVSVVIGMGAGLLTGGLVSLIEWWVATASHQMVMSADGHSWREYSPIASGTPATVTGIGAFALAAGIVFLIMLCRLPEPSKPRN